MTTNELCLQSLTVCIYIPDTEASLAYSADPTVMRIKGNVFNGPVMCIRQGREIICQLRIN
jgi:hypothetical protein